jgi:hypothetical protein
MGNHRMEKEKDDLKGFSLYVCFGKWGGFVFERQPGLLRRLCLGWVAVGWMGLDVERLIQHGSKAIVQLQQTDQKEGKT